jgi:hypothetical protein
MLTLNLAERHISWRFASACTNEFPPFVVINIWQCQPSSCNLNDGPDFIGNITLVIHRLVFVE